MIHIFRLVFHSQTHLPFAVVFHLCLRSNIIHTIFTYTDIQIILKDQIFAWGGTVWSYKYVNCVYWSVSMCTRLLIGTYVYITYLMTYFITYVLRFCYVFTKPLHFDYFDTIWCKKNPLDCVILSEHWLVSFNMPVIVAV